MLLLVPGGRFSPRRRPQPANDEMPLRPLLEVVVFWMLLAMGGLFVCLDGMQLYAAFALGSALGTPQIIAMAVMGSVAPLCFWGAVVFWFRLKR